MAEVSAPGLDLTSLKERLANLGVDVAQRSSPPPRRPAGAIALTASPKQVCSPLGVGPTLQGDAMFPRARPGTVPACASWFGNAASAAPPCLRRPASERCRVGLVQGTRPWE
jgi:hypothetical protein